jgi:hypothetical protein
VRTTSIVSLWRLAILICILLAYVYQVERVRPALFFGQFQDDSIYFSTAKALAHGQGYTLISFPGSPPQTKYPIVFPWLLSFIWKINPNFPDNLKLAIRLTQFFGCWSLLAMFLLFRKLSDLGDSAALWLTAIFALQPTFLRMSSFVMSDLPFMACLFTVFALCAYASVGRAKVWLYALIGVLAGVSVGIRTVGVALVAGVCSAFLLKKSFQTATIIAVAAVLAISLVVIPTFLNHTQPLAFGNSGESGWDQVAAYYTSYTRFQWGMGVPSLGALAHLVLTNLFIIVWSPGPIVIGTFAGVFGKILFFASMLLAFPMWIGLLRHSLHSEWKPVAFTFLFYVCVIVAWPYPQPERFLLPFLPVLLAALWCETRRIGAALVGILRLSGRSMQGLLAGIVIGLFISLLAIGTWNSLVHDPRLRAKGAASLAAILDQREQAYRWIREHTKPEDRVVAWQDAVLYLHTGRQSLRPIAILPQAIYGDDRASLQRDLTLICDAPRHVGARYWLTAPDDFQLETHREQLEGRMAQVAAVLPVVFQSSDGSVQVHDAICLSQPARTECQASRATLFPR